MSASGASGASGPAAPGRRAPRRIVAIVVVAIVVAILVGMIGVGYVLFRPAGPPPVGSETLVIPAGAVSTAAPSS